MNFYPIQHILRTTPPVTINCFSYQEMAGGVEIFCRMKRLLLKQTQTLRAFEKGLKNWKSVGLN